MRFEDRMSVNSYVNKVRVLFKKGKVLEDILMGSSEDTIDSLRNSCPEFYENALNYIKYAEKQVQNGFIPSQEGKSMESTEERKALNKSFTLNTQEKVAAFTPNVFITAHESFSYQLLERVFDASLMVEQSAIRRFEELVELGKSFVELEDEKGCYFGRYGNMMVFVDTNRGLIFRGTSSLLKKAIEIRGYDRIERTVEWNDILKKDVSFYELVFKDGTRMTLRRNQNVTYIFEKCQALKDNKKSYYQVILQSATDDRPKVQMSSHVMIILAKYGINMAKYLILKDSLFTIDHLNMCGNCNKISNLEITSRIDNKLRACGNDEVQTIVYSYNFIDYWKHIEHCYTCMDKKDIRFKKNYLKELWTEVLKEKTAEEVLMVA